MSLLIILISSLLFVFPREVYAYIDPGSGSYLTQIVLGFVFGGVFMIKLYWGKIKNAIFKKQSNKKKVSKEQ